MPVKQEINQKADQEIIEEVNEDEEEGKSEDLEQDDGGLILFDEDLGYTGDENYDVLKYNEEMQRKFKDIEMGLFKRFMSQQQAYVNEENPQTKWDERYKQQVLDEFRLFNEVPV